MQILFFRFCCCIFLKDDNIVKYHKNKRNFFFYIELWRYLYTLRFKENRIYYKN